MSPRERTGIVALALALASSLGSVVLPAQELAALLAVEARLERRLLDEELRRHAEARRREGDALQRAAELRVRLDRMLAAELPPVEVEELEGALGAARATGTSAGDEARALRRSIYERRRRLALLGEEAAAAAPTQRAQSPISGTWEVRILPLDQQGIFELAAEGTLVSGSYQLTGGRSGSFRGTWAGGLLRLERIDAAAGFDTIFEGRLAADGRRLDGSWQATLLSSAAPVGGTWMGLKREPTPEGGAP